MTRSVFVPALAIAVIGLCGSATAQAPSTDVVRNVRAATAVPDLPRAEDLVTAYRSANGDTPIALEALSWVARGSLAAGDLDRALRVAQQTRALAENALKTQSLADAHLEIALGAAIEVEALAQAQRGQRSDAVYGLTRAIETYRGTPVEKRLEKNLNLLTLAGQPAPALVGDEHLERAVPPLTDLKGKVVLLFFWAHWCPDCKNQSPILARLLEKYGDRGLVVVAPTQRFGYVARGEPAGPEAERRYIVEIRDQYYPFMRDVPVPLAEANHLRYGVSTTPTLALVDREGIVRLYHPGQMTEEELDRVIRELL